MVPGFWKRLMVGNAFLITIASLLGLFHPLPYQQETSNWALQAKGQDIGNLLAVVVLLLSAFNLRKRSFIAYCMWLGTLMYCIYAYLVYAFAVHFNPLFLVYVTILGSCTHALIGSLYGKDVALLTNTIKVGSSAKTAAAVLIVTGSLFLLLWLQEIIPSTLTNTTPESTTLAGLMVNPVHVIDLSVVLPGMIVTGIWLFKDKPLGKLFLVPWLTFSVLMGSSIVAAMLLEHSKSNTDVVIPLSMVGSIVVVSTLVLFWFFKDLDISRTKAIK